MLRIAAALIFYSFSAYADDISGKARVIDGDTIVLATGTTQI